MKVNFVVIKKKSFNLKCAKYLEKKIKKSKNILIPGGNSIKKIYVFLSKIVKFSNKIFYLTDERLKVIKSQSNFQMIKNNLIKKNRVNFRFFSYNYLNPNDILKNYQPLPKKFDLSILSFGKDGHIASIFFDKRSFKLYKKFEFTKHNLVKRISISRTEIRKSNDIQIICLGHKRGVLLKKLYVNKKGIFRIFSNNLTFLLNEDAFKGFINEKKNFNYNVSFRKI